MAKKDKTGGKKRDVQAEAAALEKPLKKAKQEKKAEEPAAASEEESEELEIPEDFEEGSEEGSDSEDGEPSPADLWHRQLEKRAQELNAFVCLVGNMDKQEKGDKGDGKGKSSKGKGGDDDDEGESDEGESDEDSDDEEPSVEKLEAMTRLFLPTKTEEYIDSITEELQAVGCTPAGSEEEEEEDDDEDDGMDKEQKKLMMQLMRGSICMLNTKHSLPMQAIIRDALKQVDKALKAKGWEEAFCSWAAVLLAATDESHWFADTEDSHAVVSIWKQLNKQWGQIKKQSIKDLGNPSCEGGKSPDVKHALEHMLSRLGDGIKECSIEI